MKKQIVIIIAALMAVSLSSCNDWLDVQPEASVDIKELFKQETGFCEALNGIYTTASGNYLYGGLFTVEILDAMMQNYSFAASDPTVYAKTAAFDFTDATFKWRASQIWSNSYKAIVNCNLILENIDARRGVLSEGMYELIKGEALALRAYFHLDLLRFFSSSYAQGASTQAIPYVTTYSNRVTPTSTVSEVLDLVIADLSAAKALLKTVDPIRSATYVIGYTDDEEATETESTNLFLQHRRHRMNYFAVCGTLARAALYRENTALAAENAEEVILSEKFTWTDHADLTADAETAGRDRIMYNELLFGWYIPNLTQEMKNRFSNVSTGYFINKTYAHLIYEMGVPSVGSEDIRQKVWFSELTGADEAGNADRYRINKYIQAGEETGNKHYLMAPAIRYSEMYYILAECRYASDPELGWSYLNTVREKRGIRLLLDNSSSFTSELLKEYRKETFAEGQAFFAYKRLNQHIVGENAMYPASQSIFVIPLPDDEIEFGNR